MGQYVSSHGDVISHVNISSVRVTDGGQYQCTATNTAGAVRHAARLNVYGPPTIRQMGPLTAVAGETFRVTCPVGGHPIDKITWKKDGVELPVSHQQSVHSNGTLTVAAVTRAGDEGSYSCTAQDKQGRSDMQAVTLQVRVPPRLAPIAFMGGNSAGLRAQAMCFVIAGDPPITLRWYKDGKELSPGDNDVRITHASDYSSSIAIEQTLGKHAGNYTCSATNIASTVSSSAVLTVNVPPTWLLEPSDASVTLGGSLELPCSAGGFPQPRVQWRKQTTSGNWGGISGSSSSMGVGQEAGDSRFREQSFRGGNRGPSAGAAGNEGPGSGGGGAGRSTLVVVRATKDHEGRYLCQANNEVGSGLSKLITLTVHEPPRFPDEGRDVEVGVGTSATLTCRARGDPPLVLTWKRDNLTLPLLPRYDIRSHTDESGAQVLVLSITEAVASDSGFYDCQATNTHGTNSATYKLQVQDVPASPEGLSVTEEGSRFVTLSWNPPPSDSIPVAKYVVFYASESGASSELSVTSPPGRVDGLQPATRYTFRVAAENRVGRSDATDAITATTQEEPPTGHPINVKIVSTGSTSFKLRWEPPLANSTHGTIRGYYLGYRENSFTRRGDEMAFNFSTIPLSEYQDQLPSGGPASFKILSRGASANYGRRFQASSSDFDASLQSQGAMEVTLKGLRPHTRYAMVLQAYNSKGAGPTSPAVTAETMEDRPSGPPQNIACEPMTSSSLLVTWILPDAKYANGVITSYRVTYNRLSHTDIDNYDPFGRAAGSNSQLGGGSSRIMKQPGSGVGPVGVTGAGTGGVLVVVEGQQARLVSLTAYTNYTVTVAAATAAGVGVASKPITCTTNEDVPSAPQFLKAVASGPSSAIVSWRGPDHPRGRLTRYTVQWARPGAGHRAESQAVDPAVNHVVLQDLPSRAVEVWVAAHTSVGRGRDSERVSVTPSKNVGAGVWSVGGAMSVAWKHDIVLHCKVVGDPEPKKLWTKNGKKIREDSRLSVISDGSLRLLDAQRSSSGRYSCTATNTHGSDSVTYHLTVIMPPSPPNLHVIETTSSSVRLQWSVPEDGGAPVTSAVLFYRATGSETLEEPMKESIHAVNNLRCGTLYHFFSTVRNSIGSSESSSVVEARTKGRAPEAPPQFQFVTSNSSQATLYLTQWESGGCAITHFRVQYRKQHGTDWAMVSSEVPVVRTFAVGGLEPGEQYVIRVTAYNSAGATPAVYTLTTPTLHSAGSGVIIRDVKGYSSSGSYSTSSTGLSGWSDPRLLVPALVSASALLLTAATICICIQKRKLTHSKGTASSEMRSGQATAGSCSDLSSSKQKEAAECIRPNEDYASDDIYHYASASYQFGRLTPPPPAPSLADQDTGSPAHHNPAVATPSRSGQQQQQQHSHQKSFTTVVYQAPSLNDVDDAGMFRNETYGELATSTNTGTGVTEYGLTPERGLTASDTLTIYQRRSAHFPPYQGEEDHEIDSNYQHVVRSNGEHQLQSHQQNVDKSRSPLELPSHQKHHKRQQQEDLYSSYGKTQAAVVGYHTQASKQSSRPRLPNKNNPV